MNMTQLAFIKCLDCVERVMTNEGRNPFLRNKAVSHNTVEQNTVEVAQVMSFTANEAAAIAASRGYFRDGLE